jgi:hypothetical protein
MLEFKVKPYQKAELIKKLRTEVLPILNKRVNFVNVIALETETEPTKFYAICFWRKEADAERYEKELYPKVKEMLEPFLEAPPVVSFYEVEPTISQMLTASVAA